MPAVTSSLVHPRYKTEYRVTNWREYGQGKDAAVRPGDCPAVALGSDGTRRDSDASNAPYSLKR